jgi:hypothetical protein
MTESRGVSRLVWGCVSSRGVDEQGARGGSRLTQERVGFSWSDMARVPPAQWVDRLVGLGVGPMCPSSRGMNSICMYI